MIYLGMVVFALLVIIAVLPIWPYSLRWGYVPASTLTLIPLLFFFLWVFDVF